MANFEELSAKARAIRKNILEMLHTAGSGHTGGALGITDILTYLYFAEMNIDPAIPAWEKRDRFVLSAAHQVPALYATLAERGFLAQSELSTLRELGSRLQGHTYRDLSIGVETTGGSLGQGLSIANGFALASRLNTLNNDPSWHTYCLISDGELNEGQTWEALMFAAKEKLSNLTIILDRNGIQLSNDTEKLMPLEPLVDKLRAFNLHVLEIDGHDFHQLGFAFGKSKLITDRPTLLVASTIPGKGVSFMENKWEWHGKVVDDKQLKQALQEL